MIKYRLYLTVFDRSTLSSRDCGGELLEFNRAADHVHSLVNLPPNLDLSRFVNNLKTTLPA